jgi:hypothetical protein
MFLHVHTAVIQSNAITVSEQHCQHCELDLSCPSIELYLCDKFCAKLEIMGMKTYEMISTSFQEEAMGCMQVAVWVCFFEHDRIYTESGEHPAKSNDGVAVKYVIW